MRRSYQAAAAAARRTEVQYCHESLMPAEEPPADIPATRSEELRAFVLLAVLMAPVLAVLIVSGYGFLVWMFQLLTGPPGSRF